MGRDMTYIHVTLRLRTGALLPHMASRRGDKLTLPTLKPIRTMFKQ